MPNFVSARATLLCIFVSTAGCIANLGRCQEAKLPLYPIDVAVDQEGTYFVADRNLPGVWRWKDGELSIYFQGEAKYRTPLNAPRCIAIGKAGEVLVGDSATREIYRVTEGKAEALTGGKIGTPMDIAVAADGSLMVADLELRKLFRVAAETFEVSEVADCNPRGVGIDAEGRTWVVSQDKQQIQIVDQQGKSRPVVSQRIFQFPHQIVIDSQGTAFVSDGYGKSIWKLSEGGTPEKIIEGKPLQNPVGLSLFKDRLIVVDPAARKVFKLSKTGALEELFEVQR